MKRFTGLILFLVMLGCVPVIKPPLELSYDDIPNYSWEGLREQRSFDFEYSTGRTAMRFEVEGKGTVVLPDALRFDGTWRLGEEERSLDLAAAGDYQLEKTGSDWIPHQKSEEAKILEQVDRVIREALLRRKGKGFQLVADEGKTLTYSFTPNLMYLDPGFEKKFSAELVVDGRTLLMRGIHATSEDGDIHFDFTVSGVNRARRIDIPFRENFRISYSLEEGGGSRAGSALRWRLEKLGRESRIRKESGDLNAYLTFPLDEESARILGESGKLVILGLNLEGAGPEIHTRGEISDIFHVADTVARPKIQSAAMAFDSLSRPLIELSLSKAEPSSRGFDYLGLVVDGVLYEVIMVDNPTDFIRISNVTTYQEAFALKTKLEKPFKGNLRYLSSQRLQ